MFCLHRNNCIYTVCMKLVQNVRIISFECIQVDLEKNFFMFYRVYTLKHCEIISLHSYLNYLTKYLIWCYGYNFYRIE